MKVSTIITPETHPNHHVVGRHWKAFGVVYFCDSYDPSIGYWMTPIDGSPEKDYWGISTHRKNISERAIGSNYHAYQYKQGESP